jgi:hypothetical protein
VKRGKPAPDVGKRLGQWRARDAGNGIDHAPHLSGQVSPVTPGLAAHRPQCDDSATCSTFDARSTRVSFPTLDSFDIKLSHRCIAVLIAMRSVACDWYKGDRKIGALMRNTGRSG